MLHSVDTSTFKKIELELDNMVNYGNLNLTQELQVRPGLWTRPLQAPERDRKVNISWAPMKMPAADIESVLKWFGTITEGISQGIRMQSVGESW